MNKHRALGIFILAITVLTVFIDMPAMPIKLSKGPLKVDTTVGGYSINFANGKFYRDLKVRKGLDLAGGAHIVLQADMGGISSEDKNTAIESAKKIIERRVNLYGVSEPTIQTAKVGDSYRIIVELPGVYNTQDALELIGTTAKLNFRELAEGKDLQTATVADFLDTGLSGADLKKASVSFNSQNNEPEVALEFTQSGAEKFGDITKRNLQKPLAIFLDNYILTAPTVQAVITDGGAVISGKFTLDEAKNYVIQLNAGALPVSVSVLEQRSIGATLGVESVRRSLLAGFIGIFLVFLFMAGIYGKLGIIANLALIIYGLITLALYKLIPVVLTLPGLAGFILSIGMAVDSNILIFERIKEERRLGNPLGLSMELGFGRAWDSIRDANVSTLITCFILFNPFNWTFLVNSGPVRGFALTLFLGVAISLFTGIVVTRNLIRIFYKG
ncbi:protein translocase subunit SecD [candidate division WWE3 bacterium CG09_land_8_20_14_0_10_39_24]|uniref:Protein translocase subunit SecD n=2 Tax=Katanobacteria TaxID=422282 RepID=A0A2G9XBT6_UNCKA|nr:MAG: protein-export membrane protein SecD [bacterium CG2_30_40_12]OJI09219.1 MAG: protein-export membrane protein SecD [bacterium CG09_39_24]PIP04424.1 MAG: protein translocase subunit SecD [candidate division WWE3 bacterium CG23_combo_of_CG06-09_8_20_14_all_40_14]PIS12998.1 MAG: protein translocase subunit SecD [candidate division WWE3 bacterium CG09_land_8_20_14_0_10_39_24]PJE52055.1 MAG: protein translocase subunit SecD [candidate division WWE3 bacterium CG10_big_fil_rev_8_21_14_0_10_39_1